jgi:hypothetical protein
MPLSRSDCTKILRLLREEVRAALGPTDDSILSDFPWSDDPRRDLLSYLMRLIEIVGLGTQTEAQRALRLIREHIRTESNQPITDVRLLLSPGEQDQFGLEYLPLLGDPALDQLRADLRSLRNAILEDSEHTSEGEQ